MENIQFCRDVIRNVKMKKKIIFFGRECLYFRKQNIFQQLVCEKVHLFQRVVNLFQSPNILYLIIVCVMIILKAFKEIKCEGIIYGIFCFILTYFLS